MAQSKTAEPVDLRRLQLFFLAAAVFVVSAGYRSLLPLLPGLLDQQAPGSCAADVACHVGFLSGAYTAGVLIGAPLWGLVSDRLGRKSILVARLVGYVASAVADAPAGREPRGRCSNSIQDATNRATASGPMTTPFEVDLRVRTGA